ncbi:hypothetical protein ACP70R_050201 [Stipagrostis hirtigluma subsp. patula]
MKTILASETMDIPEEVTVKVAAKVVTAEGPRGKLTGNFKHLNLDFQLQEGGRKLKVDAWFGTRRTMAAIRAAISRVQNLITAVTKGYHYKIRFLYAPIPINAAKGYRYKMRFVTNSNTAIEIRNRLREKKVRKVDMLEGVTILRSDKMKDEPILDVNQVRKADMLKEVTIPCPEKVKEELILNELDSRSSAPINQTCT